MDFLGWKRQGCLRYWDLCSVITIDAAVALWCGVEPGELRALEFSTHCMDAKREAIINALFDGRLEYEDRAVPRSDGRGVWIGARLDELIAKDGVRIKKDSLRRWFEDIPIDDRPAFLFDEERQEALLPDGGEAAEMNSMIAMAIMAWILSENRPIYQINERPNASAIGKAVSEMAEKVFNDNDSAHRFKAFHKKLGKALNLFDEERVKGSWWKK